MDLLWEGLKCVRILLKTQMKEILSLASPNPTNVIIGSIDHIRFKIKSEVVTILNKIAQIHNLGHRMVLQSFDENYARKKLESRFTPLVEILKDAQKKSSSKDSIEGLEERLLQTATKESTLALINHLINNTTDFESRFNIRSEFINLQLLKIFEVYLHSILLINLGFTIIERRRHSSSNRNFY